MRVRVGVVGVGHMGEYHVRIYKELSPVELVGVVDIDTERLKYIGSLYTTPTYTDYQQLYDKVDAVSIAVPTYLHYKVAYDFLKAGIHILLEKPMTLSIEEAEELFEYAEAKNLVLQVGHIERFNAAVQELKFIVNDPIFIETRRLGPYLKKNYDTGVILDLLIHDIDIVLSLVNSEVADIHVAARKVYSNYEDIANVVLTFKNGCIANLVASRVTENKIRTLTITQKDAYIFLDYANQDLHIHRHTTSKYILSVDVLRYKHESFIERLFIHKDNPLKLELAHFVNSVRNANNNNNNTNNNNKENELNSLKVTLEVLKRCKN